jgi:hypothetical protein
LPSLFFQVVIPIAGTFNEVVRIANDIIFILIRHVFFGEDGFRRTNRYKGPAINTNLKIDKEKIAPVGIVFRTRDDAVDWTNLDTVPSRVHKAVMTWVIRIRLRSFCLPC